MLLAAIILWPKLSAAFNPSCASTTAILRHSTLAADLCSRSPECRACVQQVKTSTWDLLQYNMAFKTTAKCGSWNCALSLLQEMQTSGVTPNVISFNSVISTLKKGPPSLWESALALLKEMHMAGVTANVQSFSTAISVCARCSQWEQTLSLLEDMRAAGITPSEICTTAAISACTKSEQWKHAVPLLEEMRATGVTHDVINFHSSAILGIEEKRRKREAYLNANTKEREVLLGVLRSLSALAPRLSAVLGSVLSSVEPSATNQYGTDAAAYLQPHSALNGFNFSDSLDILEAALQVRTSYRSLPDAFGPTEATSLLSSTIHRHEKFNDKNLPQEMSLVTKLWALARGAAKSNPAQSSGGLAVIDFGAGGGDLAFLAALVLDAHAVLIDRHLPVEHVRVENRVPEPYRSKVLRVSGDIRDLSFCDDVEPLLQQHGIRRAVVVAKHLCGSGTDLALDFVSRWQGCNVEASNSHAAHRSSGSDVELLGVAFATCCGHKIIKDVDTYARLNSNDPFLRELTCRDASGLHDLVKICTPCVSWRTAAHASSNRLMPEQVRAAEIFEDVLQQPRLNKLKSMFPRAVEVAFVPARQSLQNRCILAGSADNRSACQNAMSSPSDGK